MTDPTIAVGCQDGVPMPTTRHATSDDGSVAPRSAVLLEVTPGRPWRDLGDRIVLFDQEKGLETVITGSGVVVWRIIAPRRRASEVTDELTARLGKGSQQYGEALSFIDQLLDSGIFRHG